jgi:signal transduction histidine kinase
MQTAADVTLAVGLAGLSAYSTLTATTPIVVAGGPTSIAGPRWIVAAAQVVAALALIRRRRAPLATLVTVVVVLAVPTLVFGGSEGLGSFAALAVALYSAGAHCERRQAVVGLVVLTGFWVLLVVRDPLNEDIRDMLGSWPVFLVYVLVWLLGVYLRTRRLYVAQLRERAEHAERDREERVRAATADERARIARELHDAVAHAMSVIVVQAEAADEMLALGAPERARVPIERIQRIGREGLVEMRRLLGVLRHDTSPAFAPLPGIPALRPLADDVSATGLPVVLTIEGEPRELPAGVDISAYRIVQEALTNAIKHASASKVDVHLRYGDELELEIVDDGVGPVRRGEDGHGLVGMRERVALYGGTLSVGTAVGGGFRICATLPFGEPA